MSDAIRFAAGESPPQLMDLTYGDEYEDFRSEVRMFLASNWPPQGDESNAPRTEREQRFRRLATEAGYLYRNVPRRFGGSEQPPDSLRAQDRPDLRSCLRSLRPCRRARKKS